MSKAKKALLQELGQTHLFDGWGSKPSAADESRFYKQIEDLDASYPGGLKAYVDNGRKLLADSKAGVNPLEGWTPSVPVGETVAYGTPEFDEVEAAGMAAVSGGGCGFVLVAGGLGERLGYSGIKVQLPSQLTTGTTYLELYIRHILALQGSGAPLPLAIMTSVRGACRAARALAPPAVARGWRRRWRSISARAASPRGTRRGASAPRSATVTRRRSRAELPIQRRAGSRVSSTCSE